ncbi:polyprenyl synthetase family protein [Georgenia sp. SUBG003]|uniref:polyprenyl synthetase family protein n=1 Tax=Georgenia sp. SUBG003 TaxID=1497974 RepID=UPI003AB3DDAE
MLAGDLALVAAVRAVASCGAPPETVERLLDLLDRTVHATAAGELTDVGLGLGLEADAVSLGDVLTMSERKTAVYSFVLPLQAGALLAGAPTEKVERLGEIGRLLGIGFQLVDDLQGVFGDEAVTGKSALTDLREGKLTPLIAHARTTDAWAGIAVHLGDPDLDDAGAAHVRTLLTECGSRAVVEELAQPRPGPRPRPPTGRTPARRSRAGRP